MKVKMYTRTSPPCPYCVQAKSLAGSRGIVFENIDIGKDITAEEFVAQYPGAKTVPLILIDDEVIGGFNDFKNYLLTKSLNEMSL